jgi:hypothetical protein
VKKNLKYRIYSRKMRLKECMLVAGVWGQGHFLKSIPVEMFEGGATLPSNLRTV